MRVTHEQRVSTRTLKEFLEFNVDYVRKAVTQLSPGDDLQPTVVYESAAGELNFVMLEMKHKTAVMAAVRRLLHAEGATMYAMITAAWSLSVDKLNTEEGQRMALLAHRFGLTHPLLVPHRKEIYAVSVGDKLGTLVTSLDVVRGADGRITHLIRDETDTSEAIVTGRLIDLLAEPPP